MLQYIDDQIIMTKEDGDDEVLRKPECFTYHDRIDPSCARCRVRQICIEVQEQNLPPCYGLYHAENVPECRACILESQCTSVQYIKERGKMPTIMIRKPATAKPVVQVEAVAEEVVSKPVLTPKLTVKKVVAVSKPAAPAVEVVDAQPELPDTYGLTDWPIEQLRQLAGKYELPTDGRKSVLVQRLLRSEDVVAELVVKDEPQDAAKIVETGLTTSPDVLMELSMRLSEGQSLLMTPTDDGAVIVRVIGISPEANLVAVPQTSVGHALRGDAYDKEVWTEEYYNFIKVDAGDGKPWANHTNEEKLAAAKSAGVTWEEHADGKINAMRMFDAVTAALGLEKYKPQYKAKAAREALR